MNICAIGDPHGNIPLLKKIPLKDADLILVTGDLSKADLARKRAFANIERKKKGLSPLSSSFSFEKRVHMELYTSAVRVVKYLSKFSATYSIFGNAEPLKKEVIATYKETGKKLPVLEDALKSIKTFKDINNKLVTVKGVRIAGLQYFVDDVWVRTFWSKKSSDYAERLRDAKKSTAKAKKLLSTWKRVDILVCHQPPLGVLDRVTATFAPAHWQGKHAGSKVILDYIKKYKPSYVFCGHIHEGKGYKKIGVTHVYNLGVCGYKKITM